MSAHCIFLLNVCVLETLENCLYYYFIRHAFFNRQTLFQLYVYFRSNKKWVVRKFGRFTTVLLSVMWCVVSFVLVFKFHCLALDEWVSDWVGGWGREEERERQRSVCVYVWVCMHTHAIVEVFNFRICTWSLCYVVV